MKKILILTGRYLPGHKDGGPLRTIINLTDALGDDYKFYIACLDRDHGDEEPYPDINCNVWVPVRKALVMYLKPNGFSFHLLKELASDVELVYLCGFYNDYGYKTLILNRLKKISCPVAIASMGVFSKGALSHKSSKKKIFITLCKFMGLFDNVTWSVTSKIEADDVIREIGNDIKYIIAEDIPRMNVPGYSSNENPFSVVFLSRICPQKNLLGAINILKKVKSNLYFFIYGPIEDTKYWEKCKKEMTCLPTNIVYRYCGDVASDDVQKTLSNHNVLLLPTLGENYGHVIFEALSVGCIPVISNKTPWIEVETFNAGYICSLSNLDEFSKAIDKLVMMNVKERDIMAENCVNIAQKKVESNYVETGYRKIFG